MIDREFDVRAYDQGFRDGRAEAAAEIERLRAEVQVWINHTKTAVWSDSEECKLLTEENAKLRGDLLHADITISLLNSGAELQAVLSENAKLRAALSSIAKNTCCGGCGEAALVARAALGGE